jgi:CheY-like chemotaxis protein
MRILLISPDLMISSRIDPLAAAAGARVTTLRSPEAIPESGPYDLVLLDLQTTSADAATLVAKTREMLAAIQDTPPPTVAFGPHVATQRLDDAKAAGAAEVISRGGLLGGFQAVLARHRTGLHEE